MTEPSTLQWYSRPEPDGPWRIAACAEHGARLQRFRFEAIGTVLQEPGQEPLVVKFCAVCERPETIEEIERCTCEAGADQCPVHSELALAILEGEGEILDALHDLAAMANDALDLFEEERKLPPDTYRDLVNAARRVHEARSKLNIPYHRQAMLGAGVRTDELGREVGRAGPGRKVH